jgi:hypothetical protein
MHPLFCLGLFGLMMTAIPAMAQSTPLTRAARPGLPPLPPPQSPVSSFRELIEMSPEARAKALEKKPEASRKIVEARLKEFDVLPPDQRKVRLRLMQLRWELMLLVRNSPTNRTQNMSLIPEEDRGLINERLAYWDKLSPGLQKWALENEMMLSYFISGEARSSSELTNSMTQWSQFSFQQQRKIYEDFREVFGLAEPERQRIMAKALLPERSKEQREQIDKVLQLFEKLPRSQQEQWMASFRKFSSMSMEQQAQFLQNAQRWEKMPEQDKEKWRSVPPLPPLPQRLTPPSSRQSASTNR